MVASCSCRRRGCWWQVLLKALVEVSVSLALVLWVSHLLWRDAEDDAERLEGCIHARGQHLEAAELLQSSWGDGCCQSSRGGGHLLTLCLADKTNANCRTL